MKDNKADIETSVNEMDIDVDALLNAGSIMTGEDNQSSKKPNLFSKPGVDVSFIDNPGEEDKKETKDKTEETIEDIIDTPPADIEKPQVKTLITPVKNLIEKKVLFPFEGDKTIEDYNDEEMEELIEENIKHLRSSLYEEVADEFVESLPEEMKVAAEYISKGGRDLKSLFRVLSQAEEAKELDPTNETHQELIVRNYLQATKFGNDQEIQEEIDSWKDHNELEAKALKFKPKLDSMHQEIIAQNLKRQEVLQKKQEDQAKVYQKNIYDVINPGQLNGVKLDKKTQDMLYVGLVSPQFPSITGKQTNLLGHLLEKYQFVEPNHALVAEALWLLADPDNYKKKIRDAVETEVTAKTVKTLKTEEASKRGTSAVEDEKEEPRKVTLKTPTKNFFKR
jgi:hypothetical protein